MTATGMRDQMRVRREYRSSRKMAMAAPVVQEQDPQGRR
jgi:hypothetical protein